MFLEAGLVLGTIDVLIIHKIGEILVNHAYVSNQRQVANYFFSPSSRQVKNAPSSSVP